MTARAVYKASAEDPDLKIWWYDDDDSLINLVGYTLAMKIGDGTTATLTKSSGITGAAGSGTEPSGTPNVVVQWDSGELNLTPGQYVAELTATSGGRDRVVDFAFEIRRVMT